MELPPNSYAPFVGRSQYPSPLTPPHTLGLLPHPGNRAPPLPRRPPHKPLPQGWTRTFHAIPAAYPRGLAEGHGQGGRGRNPFRTVPPKADETKQQRQERTRAEALQLTRTRMDAREWSLEEAMEAAPLGLFVCAERWRRDGAGGGETIVCTHANGMQKEHWHPVLLPLLDRLSSPSPSPSPRPTATFGTSLPLPDVTPLIDDIWLFDYVNHGASADLNDGLVGPAEIWDDVGRDVLNFVLHVLPGIKALEGPEGLDPRGVVQEYQPAWYPEGTYPPVKIIGFGASFGGNGQIRAATLRPDAFTALFLCDPMVRPYVISPDAYERFGLEVFPKVQNALKRRDTWPSRAAARAALLQLEFYQRWDEEIFDLTVGYNLVPCPGGEGEGESVTLATPSWMEATVFCEPVAAARGWDMLDALQVPTAFVMARDPERTGGETTTRDLVWRPALARNERLVDADHLLVQENPAETSRSAWRFLCTLAAGAWGNSREEIRATYPEPEHSAKL